MSTVVAALFGFLSSILPHADSTSVGAFVGTEVEVGAVVGTETEVEVGAVNGTEVVFTNNSGMTLHVYSGRRARVDCRYLSYEGALGQYESITMYVPEGTSAYFKFQKEPESCGLHNNKWETWITGGGGVEYINIY